MPVINGVIVANTLAQAEAQVSRQDQSWREFAAAALAMAALKRNFSR